MELAQVYALQRGSGPQNLTSKAGSSALSTSLERELGVQGIQGAGLLSGSRRSTSPLHLAWLCYTDPEPVSPLSTEGDLPGWDWPYKDTRHL